MRKIKLFFLLLLFLNVSLAFAEGGETGDNEKSLTITGTVIDFSSNETLTGAKVMLIGSQKTVYTGFDGEFSFSNITPGQYSIVVSYVSYEKELVYNVSVTEDFDEEIVIEMRQF